ncbi:methylated-DNA-[protein]-cysteine S-methyltransferase [Kribbella orskensis]|uniref:Methylated-DNA--protein-cysteine methyltransferase n=1 Tax=Kribbella orskensis TaxID=2512216 RepID=A0ABY2B7Q4_9ACTN|nr:MULTISPECIES: methylated-DNA--[protein]-cysteine S-methyltransferase [Kribbella]TCN30514.1 methylated-DNA-[protein]-cysteine S-methyltransferase [Kribbella sp. VKM Ac-2500]TCO11156.1 methylated-DNA-[protein]-cysteine S-methyltransferase [Kribbella orskensis]
MTYAVIDSPLGRLTLVARDQGELAGLYMEEHRHRPPLETFGIRDDSVLPEVVQQLKEYFAGERTTFDIPLALTGTPFQHRVWTALQDIPYGETTTYGELAASLGLVPGASRAVGLANGKNPVSIIVPCHRVVGSTGSLTGYGGGLDRKQRLLDHERADVLF